MNIGNGTGYLHVDAEYRRRWEEYETETGIVHDSRHVNWRNVPWRNLKAITLYVEGHIHRVTRENKPNFVCFIRFRTRGQVWVTDKETGKRKPQRTQTWVMGWTDGDNCYLKEIDFYTGQLQRVYVDKLQNIKGHLHHDFNSYK